MPGWILTPLARAQLQGILDYIEEDSGSEARALKVLDDFLGALDLLTDSPRIGWRRSGTETVQMRTSLAISPGQKLKVAAKGGIISLIPVRSETEPRPSLRPPKRSPADAQTASWIR